MNPIETVACDKLLTKLMHLKYGSVCQVCFNTFQDGKHKQVSMFPAGTLDPLRILPDRNLRYNVDNLRWSCTECRDEEITHKELFIMFGDKLTQISKKLPLLGFKDVKRELQKQLKEVTS